MDHALNTECAEGVYRWGEAIGMAAKHKPAMEIKVDTLYSIYINALVNSCVNRYCL